jgi:hypothetical protein
MAETLSYFTWRTQQLLRVLPRGCYRAQEELRWNLQRPLGDTKEKRISMIYCVSFYASHRTLLGAGSRFELAPQSGLKGSWRHLVLIKPSPSMVKGVNGKMMMMKPAPGPYKSTAASGSRSHHNDVSWARNTKYGTETQEGCLPSLSEGTKKK